MTEYTENEQMFLDRIAPIKGITFLGFETIDFGPMFRASTLISRLDERNHSDYDIEAWVVRMLKRERIAGEFYLGVHYTYAHVRLPQALWWAYEILQFTNTLHLASTQRDYWLHVGDGQYQDGDEYVNYKEAYRWIKPPANAPMFWDK